MNPAPGRDQKEERELIRCAIEGDADAFGILYERYLDPIYRYIFFRINNEAEAEDLTEEVFYRAWVALPRHDSAALVFSSWLYRIAHNLVIDYYRKRRPDAFDTREEHRQADRGASVEQIVHNRDELARIMEAVRQLSDEEQTVLILRFVEGLSHRDVAAAIGKSEASSRVIQHRALTLLRRILGESK